MKFCTMCKKEKKKIEFNKNLGRKDGYNTICRDCSNKRCKVYYQNNKDKHIQVVMKRNTRRREELYKYVNEKKTSGCSLCKENDVCCLDYHHLNSKHKDENISRLIARTASIKRIEKEILKCILVCSNCHRKIHVGRNIM